MDQDPIAETSFDRAFADDAGNIDLTFDTTHVDVASSRCVSEMATIRPGIASPLASEFRGEIILMQIDGDRLRVMRKEILEKMELRSNSFNRCASSRSLIWCDRMACPSLTRQNVFFSSPPKASRGGVSCKLAGKAMDAGAKPRARLA